MNKQVSLEHMPLTAAPVLLSREERALIEAVRAAPPHASFEILKKPSRLCPEGSIVRIETRTARYFDAAQ